MDQVKNSTQWLKLLSRCLLAEPGATPNSSATGDSRPNEDDEEDIFQAPAARGKFAELWNLANSHHVILRAFPALQALAASSGNAQWADWIASAIAKERARIRHAMSYLSPICHVLEEVGDVIVIKSLDHWPDLGSDLDLYTNAEGADVVAMMRERFDAKLAERSWGDRLANKWNFIVPGLPELVEVHVSRLGQTGEQIAITESLVARSRAAQFGSHNLRVPAPEDRMIISTLQRMYRHFYIRLCDVVDNARLVDSGKVNYFYLRSLARSAGLWEGLATYLTVVSGYVASYRGEDLPLPSLVVSASRFGSEKIHFKRNFLRVPMFPHAAGLYASEWKRLLLNGELRNTLRLSLLPGLATAAAVELKLTGSDKGIW